MVKSAKTKFPAISFSEKYILLKCEFRKVDFICDLKILFTLYFSIPKPLRHSKRIFNDTDFRWLARDHLDHIKSKREVRMT